MPFDGSSPVPPSTVIFRKTKMCKFHMVGRCMRNDACTYAHSAAELEPLPDFHCTKMCPSLTETGRCARGTACTFAHRASELRAPRKAAAAPQGATANSVPAMAAPVPAMAAPVTPMAAPLPAVAPVPAETLVSLQRVLAGMGVVLLQVLPPHKPMEQQGGAGADSDVTGVSWSRQSTKERQALPSHKQEGQGGVAEADDDFDDDDDDIPDAGWDLLACDDKPSCGWSRQSTEEGIEEPHSEFSRESTESSEECAWACDLEKAQVDNSSDLREVGATGLEGHFERCGLAYAVKNTFLQFNDQEAPPAVLRRVLSTGSCAVRDC